MLSTWCGTFDCATGDKQLARYILHYVKRFNYHYLPLSVVCRIIDFCWDLDFVRYFVLLYTCMTPLDEKL